MYNMLVGEVPFFTMPGSLANKKNRAQIAKRQLGPHHKRQMAHLGESKSLFLWVVFLLRVFQSYLYEHHRISIAEMKCAE